jgi:hypothetical protein
MSNVKVFIKEIIYCVDPEEKENHYEKQRMSSEEENEKNN